VGRIRDCFEGAVDTLALEKIYAIVHAYHSLAPDMRLGVVIFADHRRNEEYKDRQVSVAVRLDVHVAFLALIRQPFLVCH
jgi:hypothetical protein